MVYAGKSLASKGSEDMSAVSIREQILGALRHEEAEDGLYFNNLIAVHEDEERPVVAGTQEEILSVLGDMIQEGEVVADDSGPEVIFRIGRARK